MLNTFFQGQMDYIFFVTGLAFMLLACVGFLLKDKAKDALSWRYLSLFAIIYGLTQWIEIVFLSTGETHILSTIKLSCLTIAYILLIEFGRTGTPSQKGKSLGQWILIPLLMVATAGTWAGISGIIVMIHYVLGMTGSLWAAAAFFRSYKRTGNRHFAFASVGMVFFSFITCVLVPTFSFYPASLINQESFSTTIGFPVQPLQMLLAILITATFVSYYRVCSNFKVLKGKLDTFQEWWFIILVFFITIVGWFSAYTVGNDTSETMRKDLISRASLASSALDTDPLSRLSGSANDLDNPAYLMIKQKLIAMRQSNPDLRFIYLMALKGNNVVFMVDSEPVESKDYSPPGEVYTEASSELFAAFKSYSKFIEGPLPDSWGVWVSGLVPIIDSHTRRLLGMFGMDIDAKDWQQQIFRDRSVPITRTLLILLLVGFYFFYQHRLWLRTQHSLRYQAVLLDLAKAETSNLRTALQNTTEKASWTLEVDRVSIWKYDQDQRELVCDDLYLLNKDVHEQGQRLLAANYPRYFQALEQYRTIAADDARSDPRTSEYVADYLIPMNIYSMLDTPIWLHGKVIGVVCIEHVGRLRKWKADELDFAVAIANMASLAYEETERRQAEEEKRNLEAKLQRAQKMEAIGTLAGGVAHDLNNILSATVSYPDLLLLKLREDDPFRKPLLTIKESGEKAAAIVNDLLTLARRGVCVTEVVNLNTIITRHLESPEHEKMKFYHPHIKLEISLQEDILNIKGSPVHLAKTVMNLISNAAEAMPDGGKIILSTDKKYLDKPIKGYDTINQGEYVVLTISDSGIGIPEENLSKIFEPFYTKKVMGRSGTGLGMSVVWGTVQDHQGYIDIESTVGQGTSVKVYFPVTSQEIKTNDSFQSIEKYYGNKEHILVVDDVAVQREIASSILKTLNYEVETAASGEEAIEYLKSKSYALLTLDMIMDPGIDGLATYQKILESHPNQKAIIVSGFSETDRVKEAQKLGAGTFIQKPYTLDKIGLAIKQTLTA